jgi:hypothetical protein
MFWLLKVDECRALCVDLVSVAVLFILEFKYTNLGFFSFLFFFFIIWLGCLGRWMEIIIVIVHTLAVGMILYSSSLQRIFRTVTTARQWAQFLMNEGCAECAKDSMSPSERESTIPS